MFFSKQVLIIRTVNCINTTSGIYHYAGLDGTRGHIDTIDCPDVEHLVVRNMWRTGINKYKKKIVPQVGYLQRFNKIHDQKT